jgi:PAS domain S-box-containing protein
VFGAPATGIEESAEDLYETAPCGYVSATPDGTLVRVNATFLAWTGYTREELVGRRRFQDLLTVGGRIYHETHIAPLLRMQGAVAEIAVQLRRKDGSRLPALLNSQVRVDAHGAPAIVRTTVIDATDRRRYEEELRIARDRERAARERVTHLQRLTAVVAAATDRAQLVDGVVTEVGAAFATTRAGLTVGLAAEEGPAAGEPAVHIALRLASGEPGMLWLALAPPRPLEPEERDFLRACAEQAALGLDRIGVQEEQRDVARVLQRSLLAGPPLGEPRLTVAHVYTPGVRSLEVGGDWHDEIALPGGDVVLVVGDVVGRGLGAASAMGQLRSATRALAVAGLEPAELLERLDDFVAGVDVAAFATLAVVRLDPATGEGAMACAGHPPPLLIPPGAPAAFAREGRSPPLAARMGDARAQGPLHMAPGATLLLYTDGLVERRGDTIDDGLARLEAAVAALGAASPRTLVDALPDLLGARDTDDDVCLLAVRRRV